MATPCTDVLTAADLYRRRLHKRIRAMELRAEGKTWVAIAEILDTTASAARRWAREGTEWVRRFDAQGPSAESSSDW